MIFFYL